MPISYMHVYTHNHFTCRSSNSERIYNEIVTDQEKAAGT